MSRDLIGRPIPLADFMRQFKPAVFLTFTTVTSRYEALRSFPKAVDMPLLPELLVDMPQAVALLTRECDALGLAMSAVTCRRISAYLGRPKPMLFHLTDLLGELQARFEDETAATLIYSIDPSHARLFTAANPFGDEVAAKFGPETNDDIEEAGRCLALDRSTGAVFHLMRVLEAALQAVSMKLGGVLGKDERNWQTILNSLRGAIGNLPRSTAPEKQHLGKASEIVAHLQNVKDAWRNDVMHPRASYTPEQALEIYNHTKALMGKIAAFT